MKGDIQNHDKNTNKQTNKNDKSSQQFTTHETKD